MIIRILLTSQKSFKINIHSYSTSIESLKERFKKFDRPNYYDYLVKKNPDISRLKRASVLVPITIKNELNEDGKLVDRSYFTLSKRSESINSFRGQVCFMGGKKDSMDFSDKETAYRESKEEANIQKSDLTYLAELCPLITFNTVLVTPVVVYFDKINYKEILNKNEVDFIFELPTERFLTKNNHEMNVVQTEIGNYYVHYFKDVLSNGKEITTWGFTAFLCTAISIIIHSRKPEFVLVPSNKELNSNNLNEFFEEFLFNKLAVSEAYHKNKNDY